MPNTDPDLQDGFFYDREPRSTAEAVATKPHGREVNITKAVLQRYLERWLTPDTPHRRLLERYAPRSLQFVLDHPNTRNIHFDTGLSWSSDDPSERQTQVARFMEQIKERYPLILIIDGGFRNRPAGLGDISGGRMVGGATFDIDLVSSLVITVDVMVAALDESTCNDLATLVSSVLGSPLRRFGGGNQLTSRDDRANYQILLPLENSAAALARENITEDPADSKWTSTVSLGEILFDATSTLRGSLAIRLGDDNLGEEGGAIQGSYVGSPASGVGMLSAAAPSIDGPLTIRINQPAQYRILTPSGTNARMDPNWTLRVSDRRLAVLDKRRLVLRPKRFGEVTLQLIDRRHTQTSDNGKYQHGYILDELTVTITR